MPFQIISAILGFVFTTRTLLFVLGLAVGGVMTVEWGWYNGCMQGLASLWHLVIGVFIGDAA